LPERFKIVFANFGESMITTKALSSMSEFKIKDPRTYNDLIREINGQNLLAVDALRKIKKGTDAMDAFKEAFERGRMLTKKLGMLSGIGIEPDDCTKLIEDSRHSGAFVAKLPGAGGKDSIAALTVGDEDYNSLRAFWKSKKELSVLGLNAVEQGAI
ncbi:MAG: hypothetical protein KGH62_03645, partial [Candidatus Micrarchaeota archaeon]|nr:hypothetical protein [Candidatus Micrarchaeota archaeon]